jgi:hypothetical protein
VSTTLTLERLQKTLRVGNWLIIRAQIPTQKKKKKKKKKKGLGLVWFSFLCVLFGVFFAPLSHCLNILTASCKALHRRTPACCEPAQ